jgi:hypothetical protein
MWIHEFKLVLALALGVMVTLGLMPCWRLSKRIGRSGLWSLVMLLPIVNLLVVYYIPAAVRAGGRKKRAVSQI